MSSDGVRRFGVLVPPGNTAVEDELPRYLPANVQMHTNRLYRRTVEVSFDSLTEMLNSAEQSAKGLSQANPDVIMFACTSGSFINGPGTDLDLAKRIETACGVPVITTATAARTALTTIGAQKVYAVTPYPKRLNELEVAFLEGNGFTVTGLEAIPCDDTVAIREIPSRRIAELALKNRVAAQKADAVFLACTNLHTMDQIEMLEAELGRPVLSSNLSTLWAAFDKMGIPAARGIGGKLLSRLAQH